MYLAEQGCASFYFMGTKPILNIIYSLNVIYLLKLKDYLYTEAIRLTDESIVRLREEVEKDTIHGDIKSSEI